MKNLMVLVLVISSGSFAMAKKSRKVAQETEVISCSGQARNVTVQDTISMIRGFTAFNSGVLSIEIDGEKSPIMSKGYDEERDQVIYEAPVIGKATNTTTKQTKTFANTCTVKFQASTCAIFSTVCTGAAN